MILQRKLANDRRAQPFQPERRSVGVELLVLNAIDHSLFHGRMGRIMIGVLTEPAEFWRCGQAIEMLVTALEVAQFSTSIAEIKGNLHTKIAMLGGKNVL